VVRRIVEWTRRADLAVDALDGKWRVLSSHPEFGTQLLMRYLLTIDKWGVRHLSDEVEMCLAPIGWEPP
jgi:hypothetical protein